MKKQGIAWLVIMALCVGQASFALENQPQAINPNQMVIIEKMLDNLDRIMKAFFGVSLKDDAAVDALILSGEEPELGDDTQYDGGPTDDYDEDYTQDYTFEEELDYLNAMGLTATDRQIQVLESLFNQALLEGTDQAWQAYDDYLYEDLGFDDLSQETYYEEDLDFHAVYRVNKGKLILSTDPDDYPPGQVPQNLSQKEKDQHYKMWQRVTSLVPKAYLNYFKRLEIGTDGPDNTLASVVELNDLSQWALFLDTQDAFTSDGGFVSDFDFTIIHELGHVITLNDSQLTQDNKVKNTYQTEEGISLKTSYLNLFYQAFWKGIDGSEEGYDQRVALVKDYVSDYAATNVEEDIAESFATFVTEDKPQGQSLADKKIAFFYQFKELVTLRNQIRQALK